VARSSLVGGSERKVAYDSGVERPDPAGIHRWVRLCLRWVVIVEHQWFWRRRADLLLCAAELAELIFNEPLLPRFGSV
jgi:hypothetical protein